jgi:hypothetical protein
MEGDLDTWSRVVFLVPQGFMRCCIGALRDLDDGGVMECAVQQERVVELEEELKQMKLKYNAVLPGKDADTPSK